jgi:hypothetical protein
MASEVAKLPIYQLIQDADKGIVNIFNIPNYQRGYRWTEREVKKLIDDIKSAMAANKDKYYLQPIVVQAGEAQQKEKRGRGGVKTYTEQQWSVIDGQQRLTSLFLLLCYLNNAGPNLSVYHICYENRVSNNEKIKSWLAAVRAWDDSGEEAFPEIEFEPSTDTLDIYYMQMAVKTMEQELGNSSLEWLKKFDAYIREHVYVLWYQFDQDEGDPIKLFSRINMGKIPLTVAELLKAMILRMDTNAVLQETADFTTEETTDIEIRKIKKQVEAVYRSTQIQRAAEWDSMEKQLSDDKFFRFICTDEFNNQENRMDYYFQILYLLEEMTLDNKNLPTPSKEKLFDFFEEKVNNDGANQIWEKLKALHKIMLDWYLDSEIFHKVGYLVAIHDKNESCANIICDLYSRYENSKNKTDFKCTTLQDKIGTKVQALFAKIEPKKDFASTSGDKVNVLQNFSYGTDQETKAILLLFNVLSAIASPNFRFSFAEVCPLSEKATLEHIFPQKPDPKKLKDNPDFITRVRKEIKKLTGEDFAEFEATGTDEEISEKYSTWWTEACVALGLHAPGVDAEDRIQKIGNLALLSSKLNTALSNRMFSGKQEKIKKFDKDGEYIPLCTHNVFLKYYSIAETDDEYEATTDNDTAAADQQDISLMIWTLKDIENHEAAIEAVLRPYLEGKESNNE